MEFSKRCWYTLWGWGTAPNQQQLLEYLMLVLSSTTGLTVTCICSLFALSFVYVKCGGDAHFTPISSIAVAIPFTGWTTTGQPPVCSSVATIAAAAESSK